MEDLINAFEEFFSSRMKGELMDLAAAFPQSRSVEIDVQELAKFNPDLADGVVENPDEFQRLAEDALSRMSLPVPSGAKFNPHARFCNLPAMSATLVMDLGAEHLNKLFSVEGVISLMTGIKPKLKAALWECQHCEEQVKTFPSTREGPKPPFECKCGQRDFRLVEKNSDFVNVQFGELQDLIEKIRGNMPTSQVNFWIEDDLTNTLAPGDRVTLTGILRLDEVRKPGQKQTSVYAKSFDVVHARKIEREFEELEITKEEELELLELSRKPNLEQLIVASIAPSIYGHTELKQAIALQLFGGTPGKILPDGEKIRSDMHVLLIGDPGTAKSRILQYISLVAPKCIYVAGRGASGVGLTAAAEKDKFGEGWVLKAGAMVLASGGIVAIDEFDKMNEEDRAAIHEALEQQTISIAKAGMVTQFKAKTSVLAAANPKLGRFDPNQAPALQFEIPPTLLSRFDLIFTIKDVLDEARDRKMADHILLGHKVGLQKQVIDEGDKAIMPPVDIGLLRKYIAFARRNVFPVLSDDAGERIKEYYVALRRLGEKDKTFPVTARQIEGLVRLSEAHAKMRLSPRVELSDAESAISLVSFVLNDVFVDRETGRIDSDVISIGVPKSRTDKVRSLMDLISRLEADYDLVPVDLVLKEASNYGIDQEYATRLIDELARQGDLYKPKAGHVKLSRKREW